MTHEHITDAVQTEAGKTTRQDPPIVSEVSLTDVEQGEADKKRSTGVLGIARSVALGGMSEEQAKRILEDLENQE